MTEEERQSEADDQWDQNLGQISSVELRQLPKFPISARSLLRVLVDLPSSIKLTLKKNAFRSKPSVSSQSTLDHHHSRGRPRCSDRPPACLRILLALLYMISVA